MASIYLRYRTWWVKFQHPVTKRILRENLETHDRARADLMRRRLELEVELLAPHFQAIDLPPRVRQSASLSSASSITDDQTSEEAAAPTASVPVARKRVDEAIRGYIGHIGHENAPAHVASKISMLRRFFGVDRIERLLGPSKSQIRFGRHLARPGAETAPCFAGEYLDELTGTVVQRFIEALPFSTKTKRHYREMFHHFFVICRKLDLYEPANWHQPNPVAGLPSFVARNRRIIFLTRPEIDEQLRILESQPEIQMAVAIMLFAGLRRAETLWLTRDSVSEDLSYLSVLNRIDEVSKEESSLKTGERSVTILPPLRELLQRYLPTVKGRWLIPNPSGGRWSGDGFRSRLRSLNGDDHTHWTCNVYRHSYATQRAAEGWPLFRIAREMGNSIGVVDEYYAGYIRPHEMPTASP